jgi:hypothetical protein
MEFPRFGGHAGAGDQRCRHCARKDEQDGQDQCPDATSHTRCRPRPYVEAKPRLVCADRIRRIIPFDIMRKDKNGNFVNQSQHDRFRAGWKESLAPTTAHPN